MTKTLSTLVAILLLSVPAFAQQAQEQVTLEVLQSRYEQQQRAASVTNTDPASEVRRLRSQIIDLRVERDALEEENAYLKNELQNVRELDEKHPHCVEEKCIPESVVEEERILSYVIYSLSLYRMAEMVTHTTPLENVEAHEQAQRIMAGVKSDLDTLGFDTTDMQDYPTLDELLKQFEIAMR